MKKKQGQILFSQRGSIARVLFYLNSILWLLISFNTLAEMLRDGNEGLTVGLVGFFLLVNILALFFSGKLLSPAEQWTYIFALIMAAVNGALSFTYVSELLYSTALTIDLIILGILISIRNIYFK